MSYYPSPRSSYYAVGSSQSHFQTHRTGTARAPRGNTGTRISDANSPPCAGVLLHGRADDGNTVREEQIPRSCPRILLIYIAIIVRRAGHRAFPCEGAALSGQTEVREALKVYCDSNSTPAQLASSLVRVDIARALRMGTRAVSGFSWGALIGALSATSAFNCLLCANRDEIQTVFSSRNTTASSGSSR